MSIKTEVDTKGKEVLINSFTRRLDNLPILLIGTMGVKYALYRKKGKANRNQVKNTLFGLTMGVLLSTYYLGIL